LLNRRGTFRSNWITALVLSGHDGVSGTSSDSFRIENVVASNCIILKTTIELITISCINVTYYWLGKSFYCLDSDRVIKLTAVMS
jgi:hypothetical protein